MKSMRREYILNFMIDRSIRYACMLLFKTSLYVEAMDMNVIGSNYTSDQLILNVLFCVNLVFAYQPI